MHFARKPTPHAWHKGAIVNTDSLSLFVALYQERTIAKASARSFLTPQGANRALKALESELGCPLFERTSVGLKPTAAGERFYIFAEQGLREISWLRDDISRLAAQDKPSVRVGLEPDLLSAVGIETLDSFSQSRLDVSLEMSEMTERQLIERLASGGLDCGFVVLPLSDERFETECLASEGTYILAHGGFFPKESSTVGIEDLKGVPLVLVDQTFKARRRFDEQCRAAGFEPTVVFSSNDKSLAYSVVRSGKACTIVADHERKRIDLAGLEAIPLRGDQWAFGLAMPCDREASSHVLAFERHVRCRFSKTETNEQGTGNPSR